VWSFAPLVYGTGNGLGVGSGVPPINNFFLHFFTGRSDNFDPNQNSGDPRDARFDTEGIRVSNDGLSVFISDEYGPYVYQFSRLTGMRVRSYQLPADFYVPNVKPVGSDEISGNTVGRTANKGMEGLAITPDGRTLVGIMQNALIQDASAGATKLLRIVTIDIASRHTLQYAYLLTTGTGVSEILAINGHEFLVDERDGKGRGDGSNAKIKELFKIDLAGAVEISSMDGPTAATHAVAKTPFLDIVKLLTDNGFATSENSRQDRRHRIRSGCQRGAHNSSHPLDRQRQRLPADCCRSEWSADPKFQPVFRGRLHRRRFGRIRAAAVSSLLRPVRTAHPRKRSSRGSLFGQV
jgi:hypothetical protein